MNNMQDFMISRVRVKLLELFFLNPDELYYVREITRKVKEEINAVRRELDKMLQYGLLKSEERGNRLYYFINKKYVYYSELQQMVVKSTGLGKKMRKLKRKMGNVEFVMLSGRFVEGKPPLKDEVEVLVVGDIVVPELEAVMKQEEQRLEREINYSVLPSQEFEFRKTRRDPFVMEILYATKVMVIGSETDFTFRKIEGLS